MNKSNKRRSLRSFLPPLPLFSPTNRSSTSSSPTDKGNRMCRHPAPSAREGLAADHPTTPPEQIQNDSHSGRCDKMDTGTGSSTTPSTCSTNSARDNTSDAPSKVAKQLKGQSPCRSESPISQSSASSISTSGSSDSASADCNDQACSSMPVFLIDAAPPIQSPRAGSTSTNGTIVSHPSPALLSSSPTSIINGSKPIVSPANDFSVSQEHKRLAHMVTSEPFDYLDANKGKGMRNLLMDAYNLWYKAPTATLEVLKRAVDQLHIASLLVDDIEDDSKMRRGAPVAHLIYGVPLTINSSNYRIFTALTDVNKLRNTEASSVFVEELVALHQGQGMDIFWRDQNKCPTEEDYIHMVLNKTGGLFRLAAGLVRAFRTTPNDVDVTRLSNLLGAFYQIRDDLISLTDDSHMKNKVFCEDIGEGKFSFCFIHSIRTAQNKANAHQLLNILKMRTEDVEIKKQALRVLEETGSFEYTRRELVKIKHELDAELKRLGGNPIIEKMVAKLSANLHLEKLERIDRLHAAATENEGEK